MKKILCVTIVAIMLLTETVYGGGVFPGATGWAIPHLEDAYDNGIVVNNDFQNVVGGYGDKITREQFAELIMRVYHKMTGGYPEPASDDTFTDTNNIAVFMAFEAGIINGRGGTIFAPNDTITRQEMATMMVRSLDSMNIDYNKGDGVLTIADKDKVDSWAVEGVDFAYENGFIKGDGVNYKPHESIPIEQAVIIINRVYEKYKGKTIDIGNDYKKAYTLHNYDNESIAVTYNNGNKETLLVAGKNNTLTKVISAQKTPDGSRIYFISKDRSSRSTFDMLFYYDLKSKEIRAARLYNKGTPMDLGLKYYNITSEGNIAIITLESQHLLFSQSADFISYIDSAKSENPKHVKEINYAEIEYGINSPDMVTTYFNYYGDNSSKIVRFKDKIVIEPNTTYDGLSIGSHPMILASTSTGNVTIPTDSAYNIKMKVTDLQHDQGNVGVIFGVSKPKPGVNKVNGFLVTVFPKQKKIEIGKMNNDWKLIKSVDLPKNVDPYGTLKLNIQVVTCKNFIYKESTSYLRVYINGEKIVENLSLGSSQNIPALSYFGIKSWAAKAEFERYSASGVMTVPRTNGPKTLD